jgi:hypothetical protein
MKIFLGVAFFLYSFFVQSAQHLPILDPVPGSCQIVECPETKATIVKRLLAVDRFLKQMRLHQDGPYRSRIEAELQKLHDDNRAIHAPSVESSSLLLRRQRKQIQLHTDQLEKKLNIRDLNLVGLSLPDKVGQAFIGSDKLGCYHFIKPEGLAQNDEQCPIFQLYQALILCSLPLKLEVCVFDEELGCQQDRIVTFRYENGVLVGRSSSNINSSVAKFLKNTTMLPSEI